MSKEIIKIPNWEEPKNIEDAKLKIISLGQNMSEHAYIIGKILIWVKENLEHGEFQDWADNNLWFAERTARKFMEFAEEADEKGVLPKRIYEIKELKSAESAVLETPPLPEGKYQVIYADPCWPYNERQDKKNLYGNTKYHYPSLSIEKIKKLPIKELKTENSVLFLWVATHFLEESFEIIKEWGMEYKSQMMWHKNGGQGGIGWYCWGDHEILLIATSGSFLPKKLFSSVYQSKREKHSKKPNYYYEMIETMYPDCKYLEMFARNEIKRKNWTYWGLEALT